MGIDMPCPHGMEGYALQYGLYNATHPLYNTLAHLFQYPQKCLHDALIIGMIHLDQVGPLHAHFRIGLQYLKEIGTPNEALQTAFDALYDPVAEAPEMQHTSKTYNVASNRVPSRNASVSHGLGVSRRSSQYPAPHVQGHATDYPVSHSIQGSPLEPSRRASAMDYNAQIPHEQPLSLIHI